ncbi:terminase large subunit [Dyadobacter sandarakinus]|uniref:Terminase large subunit n=1 Tax=Dyadobacter sandarakinus TaxID=2747268 RepID=A0ABX7I3T8_9BACT|nr:terminase large subunit [Dyadobacter sandarakinus]QRQ99705.1 terminase large subunit [Dyadobacter sandarakinus]
MELLNDLKSAYQYAKDVRSGKINVSRPIKQAIERFYSDLDQTESNFYFDATAAQKALSFFALLCFTKGDWKGKPFVLQPWQCFIVANIFGWKKKSNGKRRFTEAYIEIPKKNGKSELASGISLYMLMMDGEGSAEVYAAAYNTKQANICFRAAKSMAKASPHIRKRLEIQTYVMIHHQSESIMTTVANDGDGTEGKGSSCVSFDEYHVQKTNDLKNSLRSGMAARSQPLFFTITTAGDDVECPCYEFRDLCLKILSGLAKIENIFCMIYGLDPEDEDEAAENWQNPEYWKKANPNYGVSVQIEYLIEAKNEANNSGEKKVDFLTKHLNIWTSSSSIWIPADKYQARAKPEFKPPKGAVCYGGIDLASTKDICAMSFYFPDYNYFMRFLYTTKAMIGKQRKSGINYDKWIQEGWLIVAGQTANINYEYLKNDLRHCAEYYDMRFIGYDRFNSSQLVTELNDELSPIYVPGNGKTKSKYEDRLQPFDQSIKAFSVPTKEYDDIMRNGFVDRDGVEIPTMHDGNPVMNWMLGNVVLNRIEQSSPIDEDDATYIKPDKGKSKDKIDGVISDIMALGEYRAWHYETQYSNDINVW